MFRAHHSLLALLPLVAFALPTHEAQAATRFVTNCNDAGTGSLRAAAAAANSGDLIDLRGLTCTRIVLTSGAIRIPDQFITIIARGESLLTIDGNHAGRVIRHEALASAPWPLNNDATLRLRRLTIANGSDIEFSAIGGCIMARRHLRLEYVHVRGCLTRSTAFEFPVSRGGGVWAGGRTVLFHSAIYDNRAEGDEESEGGGVLSAELLHVDHSVIRDNVSEGRAGGGSSASLFMTYSTVRNNTAIFIGGIDAYNGRVVINKSTISDNVALDHHGAGGSFSSGYPVTISDSTISGNRSARTPAGLGLDGRTSQVRVVNSTIVDNLAEAPFFDIPGAGLQVLGPVTFQSSIVANNFVGATPMDIWAQIDFGAAVVGADNLIEASNAPLPVDTISADPMLGPLANNGGRTRTHLPMAGSPAIDAGNNGGGFAWDQRGPGFARTIGPRTDIGATERSP